MKQIAVGNLSKLSHRLTTPVDYCLVLNGQKFPLNECIGRAIKLTFTGNIACCYCGRKTKKSYSQGFCYPCMKKLAQCDSCIMSPERCHFSQGTCREPEWGLAHCMIPHYVYLANSSGLKVGITRHNQIPTRWVDQGAIQALPVFTAGSRRTSGLLEVLFRRLITDRTNWRAMLKGQVEKVDLLEAREHLLTELAADFMQLEETQDVSFEKSDDTKVVEITYPVTSYPDKIVSLNPEKQATIEGQLLGIKGQYLILDSGCINIRKFTSYEVSFAA